MGYIVTPDLSNIILNNRNTVSSVLQNVALILATRQGMAPMYRSFGLPTQFLGRPVNVARAMIVAEAEEAIREYEPRATVLAVTFSPDQDTPERLTPTVEVDIHDG